MSETGLLGVAVVTGGASGVGAACCRELARRGATVAVFDRNGTAAATQRVAALSSPTRSPEWWRSSPDRRPRRSLASTCRSIAAGPWLRPGTPMEA